MSFSVGDRGIFLIFSLAFGGWGYTSRMWGLTLDTIQSLEVVLANGTITTLSNKAHPDLFWASMIFSVSSPYSNNVARL